MANTYSFRAPLWLSTAAASWCFVTVPSEASDDIEELVTHKRGFGSVRVEVEIGSTKWSTSLFPDKTRATYILPVKKAVRDAESLSIGDEARVLLTVVEDT